MLLTWAIIFLVLALGSAAVGYTGVAGKFAGIARILFIVFLALTALSFIVSLL